MSSPIDIPAPLERRRPALQRETELWKQAVAAHQRLRFLGEASRLLGESLDTPIVLERLVRLVVPAIADWCLIDLLDGARKFEAAAPGASAGDQERLLTDARGQALSRDSSLLVADGPSSLLCVPLKARGAALGVMSIGRGRGVRLTPADVELAEALAQRAGTAIDNARLYALLEEQRRAHKETLDTVPAMIWYKDASNRVLLVNRAAAEWYGKPAEEICGKTSWELFPDRGDAYHRDDLAVIRGGRARRGLLEETVSPLGRRCWVRRDILPRFDESGTVSGVVVFAQDVTQIKRAEDSLRESERQQRDFVANVSHEFRTPVAAIKGFAETLRRGGMRDARNRLGFVRTIESHADRLDWLVQDLLNLSRLGSDMVTFRREKISARRFLQAYVDGVASLVARKRLCLKVTAPPALKVVADRPHLVQVFDNLVCNAVRYSPDGGEIQLEAAADGRRCRFTVRDAGPGIPAEHLPRLFERFYRVEKGDSGGNTGLGLHIVKTIVEAQGGKVWAESAQGQGAAFHVALARG